MALRWRYALLSFCLGVVYSLGALAIGVQTTLFERDVTLLAGAVIEVSFAVFGYLLGANVEARRRERRDAATIEAQLRELASARARVAQSEKLASLGQLAGAIVHEVRNPLAILRSMVQNLSESLDESDVSDQAIRGGDPSPSEICRQLVEEVDRLAHVTSSLAAFSRGPRLERRKIEVRDVVRRTVALADDMLRGRARVVAEPEPEPDSERAGRIVVDADPDLLCQVLLGLIENAADAAPGAPITLGVRSEARNETVEITVTDRGPGVPEGDRERIFEPFFTTRPDGHGLGLAVARQIVEAHGGRLAVDGASPETGGARFVLALAAVDTRLEADAA